MSAAKNLDPSQRPAPGASTSKPGLSIAKKDGLPLTPGSKPAHPDKAGTVVNIRRTARKHMSKGGGHDDESNWLVSYADMMTLLVGFFVMLQSFSKVDTAKYETIKREATKVFGGEYKVPFENFSRRLKEDVKRSNLQDQVFFNESDEGINITFRGALFFESGSSNLKAEAKQLLLGLIPTIAEQGKDFGIVVEGHTDNRPMVGGVFASNWELSSVRACSVLRLFEEKGFDRTRLKALGWGDTRPILPNNDSAGNPIVENQSQNRRVVIRIIRNWEP